MTTNIDRAAEIINRFCCGYCEYFGEEQSHALADAGLLATDPAHTTIKQSETIQTLSRLLAGAEGAATERAAQVERVRAVLTDLRDQQESARESWEAYYSTWDGAVSDTLRYTIHRITEALEGDTE